MGKCHAALEDLEELGDRSGQFWEESQEGEADVRSDTTRQSVYELLSSERVYSANLRDFSRLNDVINEVSLRGQFPPHFLLP